MGSIALASACMWRPNANVVCFPLLLPFLVLSYRLSLNLALAVLATLAG